MSLWDFAGPRLEEADRAAALATALLAAMRTDIIPITPGAGLIWHEGNLTVGVLARDKFVDLSPRTVVPFSQLSSTNPIRQRIVQVLGGERSWFEDIRVLSVSQPGPQVSPGDAITQPRAGRVGCQVTWNSGTGFLTAGHVAPNKGTDVFDSNGKLGTVIWANNPAGHGTAIEPDVAVIQCTPGVSVSPTITASAKAGPAAQISVKNSGNTDAVKMFCVYVVMDLGNGIKATVGDIYVTDSEITQHGDSGDIVLLGNGPKIIGHVTGSAPGTHTYVQSIDYQIQEAANRGSLRGLRL